jgi:hypothetical protein
MQFKNQNTFALIVAVLKLLFIFAKETFFERESICQGPSIAYSDRI